MDIRQLRYFVGIVEAKSFSRAALNLHVAQPALSLHVRNMEADLGAALLHRTPQGVVPTDAGLVLLKRARAIIADFEAAKRAVAEHGTEPAGEVRLGLPGTVGELVSVPLILAVRERYPKIRLKIREAMSGYVLEWLYDAKLDLGLLFLPVDGRGLRSVPVLREELRLFCRAEGVAGEPFPAEPVRLDAVNALSLVLPSVGHGLRQLVDEEMEREGLEPAALIEVDSYASIKELVVRGLGYSILPANAVSSDPRLRSWPIGSPPIARNVHLVRPFDRAASVAAEAVEELCLTVLRQLVEEGRWEAEIVEGEKAGQALPRSPATVSASLASRTRRPT